MADAAGAGNVAGADAAARGAPPAAAPGAPSTGPGVRGPAQAPGAAASSGTGPDSGGLLPSMLRTRGGPLPGGGEQAALLKQARKEKAANGVDEMRARRPELARRLEAALADFEHKSGYGPADGAEQVSIDAVDEGIRVAIAALVASCALWPGHGSTDRAWARQFVARVAVAFLKLHAEVVPALAQLLHPGPGAEDGPSGLSAPDPALMARAVAPPGPGGNGGGAGTALLRWRALRLLLLSLVAETRYDARARACLARCADALGAPRAALRGAECALARALRDGLRDIADAEQRSASERSGSRSSRAKRFAMIGGATLVGGAALVLTGGLAAPAIAGGLAAVGGAVGGVLGATTLAAGAFLATASGTVLLTAVFGATGGGLAGYKMSRRTGSLRHFAIHRTRTADQERERDAPHLPCQPGEAGSAPQQQQQQQPQQQAPQQARAAPDPADGGDEDDDRVLPTLAVTVCLSGFLAHDREFFAPWGAPVPVAVGTEGGGGEDGESGNAAALASEAALEAGEADDLPAGAQDEAEEGVGGGRDSAAAGASSEGGAAAAAAGAAAGAAPPLPPQDVSPPQEAAAGVGGEGAEAAAEDDSESVTRQQWRWADLYPEQEQYVVRWEPPVLKRVHGLVRRFLVQQAAGYAAVEAMKATVASSLLVAFTWPATMIQAAGFIDNPYAIARDRASKTGRVLADALMSRAQGTRPVTLVGYSVGARAVFECLLQLHRAGDAGRGIVEHAVLMGAPVTGVPSAWAPAREVVAGRVVNCYTRCDWVLGYLHRMEGVTRHVAGLRPVAAPGVENLDVSDLVAGHLKYGAATRDIFARVAL